MTEIEKIEYLEERFEISKKKICYILNIPRSRLDKIKSGEIEATDIDMLKIDRALKVETMLSKHRAIESEIELQNEILESFMNKIKERISTLSINTQMEIIPIFECVVIESMYLGLMYANRNDDEIILSKVRERRK